MRVENLFTVGHTEPPHSPLVRLCLQSNEIVSTPMSTTSKETRKFAQFVRAKRRCQEGGGGRMDVDASYTYNRRLTMSLPAAAAERQFRVNLQNDGIRYPSYKLPSPLSSSPLPPPLSVACFFLTLYIGGGEGRGRH